MVKPSALPIYKERKEPEYVYHPPEPGVFETSITMARHGVMDVKDHIADTVVPIYETGRRVSQDIYDQLLEEDNLPIRVGVIAGAGTMGLAAGMLRGGKIKRILFTGLGVGAGSAVCYPSQAKVVGAKAGRFGQCVRYHVHKSVLVAYNYMAGRPGGTEFDANLIASSIRRVSSSLLRKCKEVYSSIIDKASTALPITTARPDVDHQDINSELIGSEQGVCDRKPDDVPEKLYKNGLEADLSTDVSTTMPEKNVKAKEVPVSPPELIEAPKSTTEAIDKASKSTPEEVQSKQSVDITNEVKKSSAENTHDKVAPRPPVKSQDPKQIAKGRIELIFTEASESNGKTIEGDPGQSNPEDNDMYTTRGGS